MLTAEFEIYCYVIYNNTLLLWAFKDMKHIYCWLYSFRRDCGRWNKWRSLLMKGEDSPLSYIIKICWAKQHGFSRFGREQKHEWSLWSWYTKWWEHRRGGLFCLCMVRESIPLFFPFLKIHLKSATTSSNMACVWLIKLLGFIPLWCHFKI